MDGESTLVQNASDIQINENQLALVDHAEEGSQPKRRRSIDSRASSRVSWGDAQSWWSGEPGAPVIQRTSSKHQMITGQDDDIADPTESGINIGTPGGNATKPHAESTVTAMGKPPTIVNTTNNVQQINQSDPSIEQHIKSVTEATGARFKEMDEKIGAIHQENQFIAQTANTLVKSLQSALVEMEKTHAQHEQVIRKMRLRSQT